MKGDLPVNLITCSCNMQAERRHKRSRLAASHSLLSLYDPVVEDESDEQSPVQSPGVIPALLDLYCCFGELDVNNISA